MKVNRIQLHRLVGGREALKLAAALMLFAFGCSGSGDPDLVSGTYAARCNAACAPKAGTPCEGTDPVACANECTVKTEGFGVACAACVAEHSGFYGYTQRIESWTDNYGRPKTFCDRRTFSGGESEELPSSGTGVPPTEQTCPTLNACDGYKVASITGSTCESFCRSGSSGTGSNSGSGSSQPPSTRTNP